jgi:hypothetical protein
VRSLCSWDRITDATLAAYRPPAARAELPAADPKSVSGALTAPEHEP